MKLNKLLLTTTLVPIAAVPAIVTSCNKQQTEAFEIDSKGLVTLKDKSLTRVKIPAVINDIEVHGIATNGFKDTKVESVSFEKSSLITRIEDYAFKGCTSLKSFTVPKNVTYLGIGAFSGCTSFEICNFENDCVLQTLQERTFEDNKIVNINIPGSIMNISKGVFAHTGDSPLTKVFFANKEGWKQGTTPITSAEMAEDTCGTNLKNCTTTGKNWGYTGIKRTGKTVNIDYSDASLGQFFKTPTETKTSITEGEDNVITFGLQTQSDSLNGEYLIWVNDQDGRLLKETVYKVENDKTTKCTFVIDNWSYIEGGKSLTIKATKKK